MTLHSLQSFDGRIECELIAFDTESRNDTHRDVRQVRLSSEWFPSVDIGDVHLNKRYGYAKKRVPQSYAGMGIGARVNDDEIDLVTASLLDPVNEFGLRVTLVGQ